MTDFLLMVGGALFAMFISGIINYKKSKWVGLTEREQGAIMEELNAYGTNLYPFAQAIESKLKEKNELR